MSRLSIVIAVDQPQPALRHCLLSLRPLGGDLRFSLTDLDIIVVNISRDHRAFNDVFALREVGTRARYYRIRYECEDANLDDPDARRTIGYNTGLVHAAGERTLFLAGNVVMTPDTLAFHARTPDNAMAIGHYRAIDQKHWKDIGSQGKFPPAWDTLPSTSDLQPCSELDRLQAAGNGGSRPFVDHTALCDTPHCSVPTIAFRELGGFRSYELPKKAYSATEEAALYMVDYGFKIAHDLENLAYLLRTPGVRLTLGGGYPAGLYSHYPDHRRFARQAHVNADYFVRLL